MSELEFVSVLFFDSPLVVATDPGFAPDKDGDTAQRDAIGDRKATKVSGEALEKAEAHDSERPQKRR